MVVVVAAAGQGVMVVVVELWSRNACFGRERRLSRKSSHLIENGRREDCSAATQLTVFA